MPMPEILAAHRGVFDKLDHAHLALRESPATEPLPRLSTKLGGRPDLPPGLAELREYALRAEPGTALARLTPPAARDRRSAGPRR
jgi:hypothetical protein